MFADSEERFAQRIIRLIETSNLELRRANVERQRNRYIIHGPGADVTRIAQRRTAHGIHTHRDQINIGRGREGERIQIPKIGIGRRNAAKIAVSSGLIHAAISFQRRPDSKYLRGKGTRAEVVIARGQLLPEEVITISDGGAEFDDYAWHRQTVTSRKLQAMSSDILIREHITMAV